MSKLRSMNTVVLIENDINKILSECRRRDTDIRGLCELALKTLEELKAASVENDISTESKKVLLDTFISACRSSNLKLVLSAVPAIQHLLIGKVLSSNNVEPLLDSFSEASNRFKEIQLKVLQCLPIFMQNYKIDLTGQTLLKLLTFCVNLTSSKSNVVVNTVFATIQQVLSNYFDYKEVEGPEKNEVLVENDQIILLDDNFFEEYNLFNDLCSVVEEQDLAVFHIFENFSKIFVLEIIENILAVHGDSFSRRRELAFLLKSKLVPTLVRIFNTEPEDFPLCIRSMRIIHVLLTSQLASLEVEGELMLSFLNHTLLNGGSGISQNQKWDKLIVLEVFRSIFSDMNSLKEFYERYDSFPQRKNVFQELLTILVNYLENNLMQNQTNFFLIPTGATPSKFLSKQNSSMKISLLDHLDKQGEQFDIPQTYAIYLLYQIFVAFIETIFKFIIDMTNAKTAEFDEQFKFITGFVEESFPHILRFLEYFLHSNIDDNLFYILIRKIQKFTQALSVIGKLTYRTQVLFMLGQYFTSTPSSRHEANTKILEEARNQTIHSSELETENRGSITQRKVQDQENGFTLFNQTVTSRQATTLKAFIHLAVKLGPALQDSWVLVWTVMQWCGYYIDGPEEELKPKSNSYSSDENPIGSEEISDIRKTSDKLFESFSEFDEASFYDLICCLTHLSSKNLAINNPDIENDELSKLMMLPLCPYNATFYFKIILKISHICSPKFLSSERVYRLASQLFILASIERHNSVHYKVKILIAKMFNQLIKNIASGGFEILDVKSLSQIARKTLDLLMHFLERLFQLGPPSELLLLNYETELHLMILATLHELIDRYDKNFQNTWDLVFKILNTSFQRKDYQTEQVIHNDKMTSLVASSFQTLKLILDEFMISLPSSQMRFLVDTLYNFCVQRSDLNISFSSVSYFWLISDTLKEKILSLQEKAGSHKPVVSESDMLEMLDSEDADTQSFYRLLVIYLLYSLSKISTDERAQVRNGAILTMFQIIEAQGDLFPLWESVYVIVFSQIFNLKPPNGQELYKQNEWTESFSLTLSGLVSFCGKFMMRFEQSDNDLASYWEGIIKYLQELLSLNSVEININIFKAFQDLLYQLEKSDVAQNESIKKMIVSFWINVPVEYDFINQSYQESLTGFMKCLPPLFRITQRSLSETDVENIFSIFNKCARFPVLPSTEQDHNKPTKLQLSVLDNLRNMRLGDNVITSNVLQLLCAMLVYPFGTRAVIERKLGPKLQGKIKIPTFVALSHYSMFYLKEKLNEVVDYRFFIKDRSIFKVLKALLEVVRSRTPGIVNSKYKPLWVDAISIFHFLVKEILQNNAKDISTSPSATDCWKILLGSLTNYVDTNHQPDYEEYLLERYFEIKPLILPSVLSDFNNRFLLEDFVKCVYKNSFLYKDNSDEESLISSDTSVYEVIESFCNTGSGSTFGSTNIPIPYSNHKTRTTCLLELIDFAKLGGDSDHYLHRLGLEYFICRTAYSLKRFIAEARLLYKGPLPKIHQEEILISLNAVLMLQKSLSKEECLKLNVLYPLLSHSIVFASKVNGSHMLLSKILRKFQLNVDAT